MEVCIVGGGFSGISAAKACKDSGLFPVILEKSNSFGGIWDVSTDKISAWSSLSINTPKYLSGFSDQLWDENVPAYASNIHVKSYLSQYIAKHDLSNYFHYNCTVIKVKNHEDNYIVKWQDGSNIIEKVFHYVIICSGFFSKRSSSLKNIEIFRGQVIHSADYNDPSIFINKKVAIVGNFISGNEMTIEALKYSADVTQTFRSKYVFIPKVFKNAPVHFLLYSIKKILNQDEVYENAELVRSSNIDLLNLFGNPGKYNKLLELSDLDFKLSMVSDEYLEALDEKKFKIVQGNCVEFYSDGIVLENGERIDADTVILCTGYSVNLDFFGKKIRNLIQYESDSKKYGFSAYLNLVHPDLPRIGFVGCLRETVFCRFELQAKIVMKWLLGTLDIPREEMINFIDEGENIYKNCPNLQFKYTWRGYFRKMLKVLGIMLDTDFIENELNFKNPFILPQFLNLSDPAVLEDAKKVIQEIQVKYPNFIGP